MEIPKLILCEISKEPIGTIYPTLSFSMNIRYTNISELHFSVPASYEDNDEWKGLNDKYDKVQELRMIHVPNFGWFQIQDVQEVSDGIKLVKECTAYSAESLLQNKLITNLEGEFKLYDPLQPYESILGMLLLQIPGWKIGTVDGSLLTKTRTLNITKKNLYAILTDDLANAFECLFVFDYENYEINVFDIEKKFKTAPVYISYNTLSKILPLRQ